MSANVSVRGTGYGVRGRLPRTPYAVRTRTTIRHAAVISCLLLGPTGCEWFTDFKRQPHVVTWESWRADSLGVRGAPQGSVPIEGTAVPGWMVSYSPTIATLDSMTGIPNPVPVTDTSLANGRKYFEI